MHLTFLIHDKCTHCSTRFIVYHLHTNSSILISEKELGIVLSKSALLRVELELEKNKQDLIRNELELSKNEQDQLRSSISDLRDTKDRLSKNLEVEKQEKLTLQSKCSKFERDQLEREKEQLEKEKLISSLADLKEAKQRLLKDLEVEKQKKLALESKCFTFEKEQLEREKEQWTKEQQFMVRIALLNEAKKRLSKDLEAEKQEKLALQGKCSKLEEERQQTNKKISRSIKIIDGKYTSIAPINSRKISQDDRPGTRSHLLRRRTNSADSESILTKRLHDSGQYMEDIPPQSSGLNNNTPYDHCEVQCIGHNAKLMELKKKRDYVTAGRDKAKTCCEQFQEKVKIYEEKRKYQKDKAAATQMEVYAGR